jgi:RsiW-degrading membrane proteinase PrsW (M82 family)
MIGTVIKAALGMVGVVFLVLMVYAGYLWMIARGDEGKVEKAKDTIINCIIGIVIVVAAYAITNYVVSQLSNSSNPTPPPAAIQA